MLSKAVYDAKRRGYVTARELADRAGVHQTTVATAIRRGKLEATMVGNVRLISSGNADSFVSQYRLTKRTTRT